MKRIIFFLIFFDFTFPLLTAPTSFAKSYGIITNDYGLITKLDLIEEGRHAPAGPIGNDFTPFRVWQCFPRHDVTTDCVVERGPWNPPVKRSTIYVKNVSRDLIFSQDHAYDYDLCPMTRVTWLKLMKNQKYVCLSAQFVDRKSDIINAERRVEHWILQRIKTKLGNWFNAENERDDWWRDILLAKRAKPAPEEL